MAIGGSSSTTGALDLGNCTNCATSPQATFIADATHAVAESNEGNNTSYTTFPLCSILQPSPTPTPTPAPIPLFITMTTQIENTTNNNQPGTIFPTGVILQDRAFLKGSGPTPQGTITFYHYENSLGSPDCSFVGAKLLNIWTNVSLDSSSNPAVAITGKTNLRDKPQHSFFLAEYSGDANYPFTKGPCEPYTIPAN